MDSPVSGKELLSIIKKQGGVVERVKGSHHFVRLGDKTTIVPLHNNRNLGEGLVLKILKDLGFSKRYFEEQRKK